MATRAVLVVGQRWEAYALRNRLGDIFAMLAMVRLALCGRPGKLGLEIGRLGHLEARGESFD
jgi:hypothetical protein